MSFPRHLVLLCFAFVVLTAPARGLILIGDDVSGNIVPPPNGAPWAYVARLGGGQGSGVYLGNGFVITANHVSRDTPVFLNGVDYLLDQTYGTNGAQQIGATDLKLLKLDGDPGLPPLPLIGENDDDLSQSCTIIGWGKGRARRSRSKAGSGREMTLCSNAGD
jgi:trypsin